MRATEREQEKGRGRGRKEGTSEKESKRRRRWKRRATIGMHDFSVLPIDAIADLRGGLH
jgi:hypothetical protein